MTDDDPAVDPPGVPADLAGELAAETHPLDGWWLVPYVVEDEDED